MAQDPHDDAPLEDFFAAARRQAPDGPGPDLVNRILADAADVAQARTAPATPRPRPKPALLSGLRRLLAPLDGWPAAATLGFCAALGLTTGLMGGAERGAEVLWQSTAAATDDAADAILAFYDFENPEG